MYIKNLCILYIDRGNVRLFSTELTKPTEGLMALEASFTESDYHPSAIGTGTFAIAVVLSVAAIFLVVDAMTLGINILGGKTK